MAKDLKRAWLINGWLLLGAIPAICAEQILVDPTKPPAELGNRPVAASSELQSIIISPARRAAIINGQTVELGGKAGDVRLIEVSEGSVVLQGAKGRQVLTLFPNVRIDKKAVLPQMEPHMEEDVNSPARKEEPVANPASRAGKKEEK